jgi:hypothetical protein
VDEAEQIVITIITKLTAKDNDHEASVQRELASNINKLPKHKTTEFEKYHKVYNIANKIRKAVVLMRKDRCSFIAISMKPDFFKNQV